MGLICDPVRQKNSSQFYITTDTCPHLDGENTIIGKVVKGYNTVLDMSNYPRANDVPLVVSKLSMSVVKTSMCRILKFQIAANWNRTNRGAWKRMTERVTYIRYGRTIGTSKSPKKPFRKHWKTLTNPATYFSTIEIIWKLKESTERCYGRLSVDVNDSWFDSFNKRYIEWYRTETNASGEVFTEIKYKALLNMSAARLKCNKNIEAIQSCEEVIIICTVICQLSSDVFFFFGGA